MSSLILGFFQNCQYLWEKSIYTICLISVILLFFFCLIISMHLLSNLAWGHLLMTELSIWRIFQTDSQQINITNLLVTNLNSDISKINAWVNEWKISFKPGPSKQVQEIVFSDKEDIPPHWNLMITLLNKYCVKKSMYLSEW